MSPASMTRAFRRRQGARTDVAAGTDALEGSRANFGRSRKKEAPQSAYVGLVGVA